MIIYKLLHVAFWLILFYLGSSEKGRSFIFFFIIYMLFLAQNGLVGIGALFDSSLYYRMKDFARARKELERSIKWGADYHLIYNNLAFIISKQQKDINYALQLSELAISKCPNYYKYLDTYGWILTLKGDIKKGQENLLKAHKIDPSNVQIKFHLGFSFIKTGNTQEGNALLSQCYKKIYKIQFSNNEWNIIQQCQRHEINVPTKLILNNKINNNNQFRTIFNLHIIIVISLFIFLILVIYYVRTNISFEISLITKNILRSENVVINKECQDEFSSKISLTYSLWFGSIFFILIVLLFISFTIIYLVLKYLPLSEFIFRRKECLELFKRLEIKSIHINKYTISIFALTGLMLVLLPKENYLRYSDLIYLVYFILLSLPPFVLLLLIKRENSSLLSNRFLTKYGIHSSIHLFVIYFLIIGILSTFKFTLNQYPEYSFKSIFSQRIKHEIDKLNSCMEKENILNKDAIYNIIENESSFNSNKLNIIIRKMMPNTFRHFASNLFKLIIVYSCGLIASAGMILWGIKRGLIIIMITIFGYIFSSYIINLENIYSKNISHLLVLCLCLIFMILLSMFFNPSKTKIIDVSEICQIQGIGKKYSKLLSEIKIYSMSDLINIESHVIFERINRQP